MKRAMPACAPINKGTTLEATQLMSVISSIDTSSLTDRLPSAPLMVSYVRRTSPSVVAPSTATYAASLALAAVTCSKTFVPRRNEGERARVRPVNEGFERIRAHLPYESESNKQRRLSKVETLQYAIQYIQHLQCILDGEWEINKFDLSNSFDSSVAMNFHVSL